MKINFSYKQRTFTTLVMVCIVLIMATSAFSSPFSGGTYPFTSDGGGSEPTITPSPTPVRLVPSGDSYITPTPTPTRPPADEEQYLTLYMAPNPATQRDTILGDIFGSVSFVNQEVIVHYIDGIEYQHVVVMSGDVMGISHGQFTVMLKSGSYDFWVTYGSVVSNHVTEVVI